ncbi:putative transposase for insertion sequence element ISRM3-like protein [Mesorhizobium sp. 131-2-1]|nr:putative transposase for insertion sequence element ISRM3-like protein [Mesorhizobium sp. 131-2-1]BCH04523.1 putative transposase for insertion sequence element ISRM3-like protein [Mesorhizobium sp. 131-2-5]
MAIEKELLDQLLAGRDPNEVFAKDGLLDDLKKALSERILNAELDEHLEDENSEGNANRRNGHSRKSVLTGTSKMTLTIPRDRAGTFDPKLIAKYQRRFPDFDDKIISMYARGMTVREIRGHLEELYGIDVSPDLISAVTDAVLEEVAERQSRPLDAVYPLVFFDAIRVKIRDEGFVRNKAVYIALGILADGTKEILGIWIEQTEGAKFWLRVMNELKSRGVADVLIAVVDGLKGFPEAINAVFPQTVVQTCIVHLIRHSLEFVSWKDRKPVVPALRAIYRAKDAEAGMKALEDFEAGYWGQRYPAITQSWRRNWQHVVPFFAFPESVRRIIYTTDDIDKPDFGFFDSWRFFVRLQVSLFLRPGPQDFPCERVETQSRLAGAVAPRPAARFPGHALTASSTAPVWSGPRRRSCRHIPYAIFVRHGRPRGKEWCRG